MYTPREKSVVAKDISYTLPTGEVLFEKVELTINKGDRIALVGKNGAGKSSLMKILVGEIKPTSGSVDKANVAYVDQLDEGVDERSNRSLMEYISLVTEDWWLVQLHYEKMFGQEIPELTRNLMELSGGEYMRLKLAVATYKQPEILLLDEPTNHLDVTSKEVLRNFIDHFSGGVMVVSHDTHFVNQIAKDVWELSNHKLSKYGGDYEDYLQAKKLEDDTRQRKLTEAQKEVSKSEKALAREQKRAARSRRTGKKLAGDRSMSAIEKGYFKNKATASAGKKGEELKENLNEAKQTVEANKATMKRVARLDIVEGESRKGKNLLDVQGGSLLLGETTLIEDINLSVKYGERLSLAGENGSGKTSLIKALLGNFSPKFELTGKKIFKAEDLSGMYISQRYDQIDRSKSLLENMYESNPNIDMQTARRALGNLLFKERYEVEKLADNLSGGETARLAFAMASVSPVDILFLDEPTNNLDVDTINIIVDALGVFEGAVLVISHDINFLRKIGIEKSYRIANHKLEIMRHLPIEEGFYEELLSK